MLTSFEEYLALEERAHDKSEFYRGAILTMSGRTRRHSLITANVTYQLRIALSGTGFELPAGALLSRTGIDGLARIPTS